MIIKSLTGKLGFSRRGQHPQLILIRYGLSCTKEIWKNSSFDSQFRKNVTDLYLNVKVHAVPSFKKKEEAKIIKTYATREQSHKFS